MNEKLQKLNSFIGKAMLVTYAGSGPEADPEEKGFTELEFKDDDWSYKDSYMGYFQSWGREVVWYKNEPFWTQIYGGGMTKDYQKDIQFAHETFNFLKKSLSAGEKKDEFQPRGPEKFQEGDWLYQCEWKGDISKFEGGEKIYFRNELVFTHDFLGGLILA